MSKKQNFPIPEMRRINQIHFVGIGGVGMSGIAEVLLNQGYNISGSDKSDSPIIQRLIKMGADIEGAGTSIITPNGTSSRELSAILQRQSHQQQASQFPRP